MKKSTGRKSACLVERERALNVILKCGNSLTIASQRLGISITTLHRWRREARDENASGERSEKVKLYE